MVQKLKWGNKALAFSDKTSSDAGNNVLFWKRRKWHSNMLWLSQWPNIHCGLFQYRFWRCCTTWDLCWSIMVRRTGFYLPKTLCVIAWEATSMEQFQLIVGMHAALFPSTFFAWLPWVRVFQSIDPNLKLMRYVLCSPPILSLIWLLNPFIFEQSSACWTFAASPSSEGRLRVGMFGYCLCAIAAMHVSKFLGKRGIARSHGIW